MRPLRHRVPQRSVPSDRPRKKHLPPNSGALAKLTAADFDKRLKVLKIGQDKSGKERRIKLPDVTAELFEAATKGKPPTVPLLSREDGKAWNKDAWKWPIKEATKEAGLPTGTTAYTLRHSVISDWCTMAWTCSPSRRFPRRASR